MSGMKQSKNDYIDSVASGELKYFESIHDKIDIKLNGNIANVVGMTRTLASPFGIAKSWWKLKQEIVVEKIDGRWIIVSSVASTY